MPIDSSIYSQLKPLDIMGSIESGMKLRDMADERTLKKQKLGEENAIKEAYKANYVTNPDGSVTLNRQGVLSSLAKINPQMAMEQEQKFKVQDDDALKRNLGQVEAISQLAGSAKDQATWESALDQAGKMGLDVSQVPRQFDPALRNSILARSLKAKEQLDIQFRESEAKRAQQNEDRKFRADRQDKKDAQDFEMAKLGVVHDQNKEVLGLKGEQAEKLAKLKAVADKAGKGANLTEGQKTADKEFAKDYNEWTSGGAETAQSEINKLRGVYNNLQQKNVTTGGLTGAFPDRMTSNAVLQARADVQSTVMNSLRAILGAQFTEKEGERIIRNTWNEADSTENNALRLERLIGDLEAKALAKNKKALYYEQNDGSIAGYKSGGQFNANQQAGGSAEKPKGSSLFSSEANAEPVVFDGSQIEWAD